jgi:hypothetical protein
MDLSILKALPIGLLMFAALAWGYFRRRRGHRQAREAYPDLALRLGLLYRAPRSGNGIGQLHGTLRGFSVVVDPDEQRKLIVRFRGEPKIDFRNYESAAHSGKWLHFTSGSRAVDAFFVTRYAEPAMIERLRAADLNTLVKPFTERYRYEVKQMNLTQHGVTCVLDFGNPPRIPPAAVEELLPALLDWAEVIEPREASE